MKYSLKTKLSLTIALVVLLTVALISLLTNFFIENQFKGYVTSQQEKATQEIVNHISQQYHKKTNTWDEYLIHKIGMDALQDGYILKVYNQQNQIIWDAETCDMNLCTEIMDDISHRMMMEYPNMNGEFKSKTFPVLDEDQMIGNVNIRYYGPFFLSEDDSQFLDTLNRILIGIGIFSLLFSIMVGFFIAKHLSLPILKTIGVTKKISDGDYGARIEEETSIKEVDELIISINQLAGTLETQETLRRQLTADVAHELRTPLTTVQTHIEALIEGVWEPTTQRLQSCYDEMSRICKLVSDLEGLAKMESDNLKLDRSQVSLLELSNKVIRNFETELNNKNLHISVMGTGLKISADQDRMSQVLTNLLTNAVKYTPDGGEIKISITDTDTTVILSIEDNGIGMTENEIPFIFERFYRADKSRNRITGGSGIGLAIVKSIVNAHSGTIEVKSSLNKGSCFIVSLPKYHK